MSARHLLMMAGGTGGHIMPGLAVARGMQRRGWRVSWLGTRGGMEEQLVPQAGFPLTTVDFEGWVGRGWSARLDVPIKLVRAIAEINRRFADDRPDAVIGMGGYPTVPGGLWARMRSLPLFVHQSDAVAGAANRLLARMATRVLVGFDGTLPEFAAKRVVTGNPLREGFAEAPTVEARFAGRLGPLSVLVLGGSRGATWLNEHLPKALAMLPIERRPHVLHQCGRGGLEATLAAYARAGVTADIREFVDDTLAAMLTADLFIGRSGASTVSELAAVGLGAILVPYPHHADQQQLWNARVLEKAGAARVLDQKHTDGAALAASIDTLDRAACRDMATRARCCAVPDATERICSTIAQVVAATAESAETAGRAR